MEIEILSYLFPLFLTAILISLFYWTIVQPVLLDAVKFGYLPKQSKFWKITLKLLKIKY